MTPELIISVVGAAASLAAVIVAIVSLVKSSKVAKLQEEVSELDSKLKRYELEDVEKDRSACVRARLVKEGKCYHLRVFNKGVGTAHNVDFVVKNEEVAGLFQKNKTPFPILEQHGSYEENVITFWGFPSTVEIETIWNDDDGQSHTKINYVTH